MGDIVDVNGVVVAQAYKDMAAVMGQDAGHQYRYGPDSSAYGVGAFGTTLFEPTHHTSTNTGAVWEIGTRELPDVVQNQAGAGLYSTQQATILFAPDNRAQRPGVAGFLQIIGHQFNTLEASPQKTWTLQNDCITDPMIANYAGIAAYIGNTCRPVATGQGIGRGDRNRGRLVAWDDGLITTHGTNTNTNWCATRLAAGLVPTAVAVSNCSEFGFVTYWDKVNVRGGVAVIALTGIPEGSNVNDYSTWYDNWGEWMRVYPGLPNWGDFGYMKVLGYIDLGSDMVAPTEACCTTGFDQFNWPWHVQYDNSPLNANNNWAKFQVGGALGGMISRGGMLTVISKSEKKVAFIDLKPLFTFFNNQYFGSAALNAVTNSFGAADNQWPYAFNNSPSMKPTIVQKYTLADKPTACMNKAYNNNPAVYVALQGGTILAYKIGRYAPGNAVQSPVVGDIALVGTFTSGVGRNITRLAYAKNEPNSGGAQDDLQMLACSRGDRKIQWLRFNATSTTMSIARTIQDSRLVDPISVEDADDYATQASTLTVLDYSGKAIRNYRYGTVKFAEQSGNTPTGVPWGCRAPTGCPVVDASGIDHMGSMALPGKPFQMHTSNTP